MFSIYFVYFIIFPALCGCFGDTTVSTLDAGRAVTCPVVCRMTGLFSSQLIRFGILSAIYASVRALQTLLQSRGNMCVGDHVSIIQFCVCVMLTKPFPLLIDELTAETRLVVMDPSLLPFSQYIS